MSVGNTLVLKACGFIEDQQATILDVSESSLRVRTGQPWYSRLFFRPHARRSMEVALQIHPLTDSNDLARVHPQHTGRYCVIEARIAGGRLTWSSADFTDESRRLLLQLRSYFMAC